MTDAEIGDLWVDALSAAPALVDWSENDGEKWLTYQAVECEKCGKVLVIEGAGGDAEHSDIDPDAVLPACTIGAHHGDLGACSDCVVSTGEDGVGICDCVDAPCDGYVPEASGPMMNYFYECPLKDQCAAALAIAHLPLCVVEDTITGNTGFALTGGGMDFTWEICAAYIACGFLPPTYFELPKMGGIDLEGWQGDVYRAAHESINVRENWLRNNRDRLNELKKWVEAQNAKREATKNAGSSD